MAAIAGFIEYDAVGQPFMGLMIEGDIITAKLYIAHKVNAQAATDELCKQLQKMASELRKTKPKLIEAKGNVDGIRGS